MSYKDKGPAFWVIGGFAIALSVFLLLFIVTHSGLLSSGDMPVDRQEDATAH